MSKVTAIQPKMQVANGTKITAAQLDADVVSNLKAMKPSAPNDVAAIPTEKAFPLAVFPPKLEELIKGAEHALGMHPDFFASAVVAATGIAVGATYQVELKKGAYQKPVFYVVLIGLPNSNKTAPLQLALKPIMDRDADNYDSYRTAKAEYDAIKDLPPKDRVSAGYEKELPDKPIFEKALVSDYTQEALATVHLNNLRGIAVYRDELTGWVKDFNRYHQGSEQEFWLSNWSGQPIDVDRLSRDPIKIRRPAISVVGTIQPGVLEGLAKGDRAANGFMDRLLFSWPERRAKPTWNNEEIQLYLLEDYHAAIKRLLNLSWNEDKKPHTLKLSAEAQELLFGFFNDENKRICDTAENEFLMGMHGKFDFHTARLVVAMHMLQWAYGKEIEPPMEIAADTVKKAIRVARYFRGQSLKVYERLHEASPIDRLPSDKQRIYDALPNRFNTADGIDIAKNRGMNQKTFQRLLADREIFEKIGHGLYCKIY
jgi:hypothetical protein